LIACWRCRPIRRRRIERIEDGAADAPDVLASGVFGRKCGIDPIVGRKRIVGWENVTAGGDPRQA
jgi:hypothetical protein